MNRRESFRSLFALPLVALGSTDARADEPIRDGTDATVMLGAGETLRIEFRGAATYEIGATE